MYKSLWLLLASLMLVGCATKDAIVTTIVDTHTTPSSEALLDSDLRTDTTKISIPFDEILDGGPGKDGIPSVDTPLFVSIDDSTNDYLSDTSEGIFVTIGAIKKRYPFAILNRHEIVNDTIQNNDISVTFCPLCGSSIVFDRNVDGKVLDFGVSGKLYQSNLLMYDRLTESLWSQTLGEAVVGDYLGTVLQYVPSSLLTFADIKEFHPETQVLSTDTGKDRPYERIPYGDYENNEELFFPVTNIPDASLPLKERLYATNLDEETSLAFVLSTLREQGVAILEVHEEVYTARFVDGSYTITNEIGEELPGYFEMRFSWANKIDNRSYVWGIE